jgi:hypothetical protein
MTQEKRCTVQELTKSMTSFTWAMTVFGVQQTLNIFGMGQAGSWDRSREAFDHVTQATTKEVSDTMRAIFSSGDTVQRGMVDLLFAPARLGNWGDGRRDRARSGGSADSARADGWIDSAARAATAGTQAMGEAAAATARATYPPGDATGRSSGPSSERSTGWGPVSR